MLGLMFGNGMHAVSFVHCKLLLHKELVLIRISAYQVTRRETEMQRKRKRTYPNLSVSVSNFSVSFPFFVIFSFPFSFPLTESKFFR